LHISNCEHEWQGQRQGGPPDVAASQEWVVYCKYCGSEFGCD
jgi:hypothetical protein